MKKQVYAVRDAAVENFGNPFVAINHAQATRDFDHAAKDPQSQISQYPADYALWHLGAFDDSTGALVPLAQPVLIRHAINKE